MFEVIRVSWDCLETTRRRMGGCVTGWRIAGWVANETIGARLLSPRFGALRRDERPFESDRTLSHPTTWRAIWPGQGGAGGLGRHGRPLPLE